MKKVETSSLQYPLYLQNFNYYDERAPTDKMTKQMGIGSHMQINSIDEQLVKDMHDNGKLVVVWIDTPALLDHIYEENDDFYMKCYDLGIDMITTDHVQRADQILNSYHHQKKIEFILRGKVETSE